LALKQCWCRPQGLIKALRVARGASGTGLTKLLFESAPFLPSMSFDVIHCQYGHLGCVATLLRRQGVLHGPIVTSFRGFDLTRKVKQGEVDYTILFEEGDLFLPVSNNFRKRLIAMGCPAEKIEVVRSAIDCDRYQARPRKILPGETLRLITVGRLYEKKGIEYAIRAIAILRDQDVDLTYSIIGEGPLESDLKTLTKELELDEMVRFAGWQTPQQIKNHLHESHIAIHPSVVANNGDEEGIPNALKESMSTAMPAIATRHSGIPELVIDGETGYLTAERDSAALAACIVRVIDDAERWHRVGIAARRHVESNYHVERIISQLTTIYQRCGALEQMSAAGSLNKSDTVA
ncbi:MAG: glycosyltransferase, partial [Rubripirellula sp.]|nr:glycosyltransferase [Rubripirellula sp.]